MKHRDSLIALVTVLLFVPSATCAATVQYGEVTEVAVSTHEDDDGMSGAVKGGLLGAAIGPRRPGINRGVIAGAAIGAAVDEPDYETTYFYTVHFVDGSGSIKVHTEQSDIRQGDCVSVERGEHANIRRVSTVHCEQQTSEPPPHHTQSAKECDQAKQLMVAAETDEELDLAIQKARVLCED